MGLGMRAVKRYVDKGISICVVRTYGSQDIRIGGLGIRIVTSWSRRVFPTSSVCLLEPQASIASVPHHNPQPTTQRPSLASPSRHTSMSHHNTWVWSLYERRERGSDGSWRKTTGGLHLLSTLDTVEPKLHTRRCLAGSICPDRLLHLRETDCLQ